MDALARVVAHLTRIYNITLASGSQLEAKRAVLDLYFAAAPEILTIDADVLPALANSVAGEWLVNKNSKPRHRLLYIHGGSWMAGSPSSHRPLTSRLARATGCAVLSLAYRRAPEHPFPAGLDDCLEAYRWLLDNGPDGPGPADKIFIAGDSAGGNLTLALLLSLKNSLDKNQVNQQGLRLPDAAVAFSPATDLTWQSPSINSRAEQDPILNPDFLPLIAGNYTQKKTSLDNPLVSPINGQLSGLPPLLIQTGEAEVLLDDSRRFATAAQQQGVNVTLDLYPDMPHVFQGFAPLLPQAVTALIKVGEFIRQH